MFGHIDRRPAIFPAKRKALQDTKENHDDRRCDADRCSGWDHTHPSSRDAHQRNGYEEGVFTPQPVAEANTAGAAVDIELIGNLAVIASREGGVYVFDISNPLAPALLEMRRFVIEQNEPGGALAQDIDIEAATLQQVRSDAGQ